MPSLDFPLVHEYNPGEPGITLPVELRLNKLSIKTRAKLDTGASFCIFKRELGENLGLQIEAGTPELISTPMGSFTAYGHFITLAAVGLELDVMVYFAAMSNFPRNVLGRFGWMQQLKLGIVDYEGKLFLSKYDDLA
jgi:hypothetical protein